MFTDVYEMHQHWLQVAEAGSGLHTETQLLLKVATKGNLSTNRKINEFLLPSKTTSYTVIVTIYSTLCHEVRGKV